MGIFQKSLTFNATNKDVAQKRIAIAENLINKVSDNAIETIFKKIAKNPDWLAKLASHPLLSTL